MSKTKTFNTKVESLDAFEPEDNGFIDEDLEVGRAIASFSFAPKPLVLLQPAIDGELYTIKRCYQYRQSTVRKLNELKAKHADVNVYLTTIIDEAISHYYDFVFNSNTN